MSRFSELKSLSNRGGHYRHNNYTGTGAHALLVIVIALAETSFG